MLKNNWIKIVSCAFEEEKITLESVDGKHYGFNTADVSQLAGMRMDELKLGKICAGGLGLRWGEFDLDLFITPIVAPEELSATRFLS